MSASNKPEIVQHIQHKLSATSEALMPDAADHALASQPTVTEGNRLKFEQSKAWWDKIRPASWLPLDSTSSAQVILPYEVLGSFFAQEVLSGRPVEEQQYRLTSVLEYSLEPAMDGPYRTILLKADVRSSMPRNLAPSCLRPSFGRGDGRRVGRYPHRGYVLRPARSTALPSHSNWRAF